MGLTEPLGGQTPFSRVSARIRWRSSKLLYAHIWMKLLDATVFRVPTACQR